MRIFSRVDWEKRRTIHIDKQSSIANVRAHAVALCGANIISCAKLSNFEIKKSEENSTGKLGNKGNS